MFLAGMAGVPDKDATDGSTSYIAPIRNEIIYKTSVYEYEYYILIGDLDAMRKQIYDIKNGFSKLDKRNN
jgi:hypothetical protein